VARRSVQVPRYLRVPSRSLAVRPSGVVLTFDVCRTAVAVRLASRLHLRPCTLRCSPWRLPAARCPVGFPSGVDSVRGLAFTLEDLAVVPVQASGAACDHRAFVLSLLPSGSLPLRRSQSGESTSRPGLPTLPRRGGPIPLRSVFAVFRDLDGLLFPGPCDLFQPLTPMRFASRLPASIARCPFARFRRIVRPCAGDGSRFGRLPVERGSRCSTYDFAEALPVGRGVPGTRSVPGPPSAPPRHRDVAGSLLRPFTAVHHSSHRGDWSGSGSPPRTSCSSSATGPSVVCRKRLTSSETIAR
jgi:hypothetical protein